MCQDYVYIKYICVLGVLLAIKDLEGSIISHDTKIHELKAMDSKHNIKSGVLQLEVCLYALVYKS